MRTNERAELRNTLVRSRTSIAGGAVLGFAAFLILVAPLGGAMVPYVLHAPYIGGQAVQVTNAKAQGVGAAVLVLTPATFVLASGVVRDNVVTTVAAPMGLPASAGYGATIGVNGVTFTTGAGGPARLTTGWTVGYAASLVLKQTQFPHAPGLVALINIRATSYLVEPSTGIAVPGSAVTSTIWTQFMTSGQLNIVVAPHLVQVTSPVVLLSSSHTYAVYAVLLVDVMAVVNPGAMPGSTVTASLNLVTPRTALTFVSIS